MVGENEEGDMFGDSIEVSFLEDETRSEIKKHEPSPSIQSMPNTLNFISEQYPQEQSQSIINQYYTYPSTVYFNPY